MALEMELGVFVAMLAVPLVSMIFLGKIRTWGFTGYVLFIGFGILGFLMLGGLALAMASGYDVVQSEIETFKDAGGNVTGSIEHKTPVIDNYQSAWAYIFLGASVIFGLLYFKVIVTGSI